MTSLRLYSLVLGGTAVLAATGTYAWARSRRMTPQQREMERRLRLCVSGRLTDGTLLDVQEYNEDGKPPLHLLIYTYDVAGVTYECSQDITHMGNTVRPEDCKVGLPASVKYDPQNPGNSILVAEKWSGLRVHSNVRV